MRGWRAAVVSWLALVVTVPWFFVGEGGGRVWGLPGWAFYAVVASAGYAVVVAWALGRRWGDDEGDGDDGEGEGGGGDG